MPRYISVDAVSIYWTENNFGGAVMKANLDGKNSIMLASGQAPNGLALDGTHVYWTRLNGANNSTVVKCPIGGCGLNLVDLTTIVYGQTKPQSIAVDAGSVYWTTYGPDNVPT